jgi:prephenate dehydrogenase
MHWQKIALIGVGLLGGSLGLAIKQRKLASRVIGFVRRSASVKECEALGVVDEAVLDIEAAVREADLVILCTPLGQMRETAQRIQHVLRKGAIVTDVGSVKAPIVQQLEPIIAAGGGEFIGSHPMAGAEKTGPSAARADLFNAAVCAVTPTSESHPETVRKVEEFWRMVGANPLRIGPDLHDELVSRSSHLPHVVAAELSNYVLSPVHPKEQSLLCATGFRDTTRIASSSPEMWRDISISNRRNLARVLGVFIEDLQEFQLALENDDYKAIEAFFADAKQRRDQWCGQSTSPE